jgi:RimJ/RimL family protein N-acetyltransferase
VGPGFSPAKFIHTIRYTHLTMTRQIETPRLILREPRLEDLDAFAAMMADEETARFVGGVLTREATWRLLMTMIGAWHATGISMFSVIEKDTGRWVGRLGPWMPEGWPGTEIGWAIVRDCWRKGYASEGAAAAIDFAIERLGWTDIIHAIAPDNIASQQVARKLGSRNRGPGRLPPPFSDAQIDIWGQSREEWVHRRTKN